MKEVSLIVKVTRQCNLRCTYCMDWRASPDTDMSFKVLARLIQAAVTEHDRVTFIWHGGETTLRPISFYKKIMVVQARYRRPGTSIVNMLQTNGTRLDDEWVRFFRDGRFRLGISLDGPPEIHDRERPNVGGGGSFQQVMRGLALLRQYDVPHSVLMVVDAATLDLGADRVFDFILEHGIRSADFLSAMPEYPAPGTPRCGAVSHYATRERMTAFLRRMYDRWLEHGDMGIRFRALEAIRKALRRADPEICTMVGGCFGRVFTVEPNGDIKHCDTFQGNPQHDFGNIMEMGFSDMRQRSATLRAATQHNDAGVERMRAACPEFDVCKGGCPADRSAAFLYDSTHDDGCCGKRALIQHIRARMQA